VILLAILLAVFGHWFWAVVCVAVSIWWALYGDAL